MGKEEERGGAAVKMGGPPLLGELGLGERRRKIYTSWQSMLLAASGWVHGSSSYARPKAFACACALIPRRAVDQCRCRRVSDVREGSFFYFFAPKKKKKKKKKKK